MAIGKIKIGSLEISRFIIGGNPFSGFSHQGDARDAEMKHYYTVAKIKETLRQAESLGITTHLSRSDHHVIRYMMEYRDEGGKMVWLAQTCPEIGNTLRGVQNAINGGAMACHIHGGWMDYLLANNQLDELPQAVAAIRKAGMPAGLAGHNPKVFQWAEKNLDVDYYMCSYYNSAHRDRRAEHVPGMEEWFLEEDRRVMTQLIQGLSKPVIHYKVLAAGRNDPQEAFDVVARHLRPQDAVCVGIDTKRFPNSIADNIRMFEQSLKKAGKE